MSTVLSRNGKVLTANNKALTHQSGDVNVQASKSYTVSSSGSQTVSPDTGYDAMGVVSLTVPAGSATPASTISSTGASVSAGTNTITLSKSAVANTPAVSAGYISTGTQGNSSVSLTASVNTQGTTTYTPTTTNQTIASGTYLTGTQTISGSSNLTANNIKKDVVIFGVTGSYEGSGGGNLQPVKEYTVSASGNQTISPDTGYDGIEEVALIVPSGSGGTPYATKGTVSNHAVSVTPSVTNTTGWITGEIKDGTPVSVSASELVSGTYTVNSSGTKDVTNYESISVPAGTATAPSSISGSSASVSTGTNTLTLSKTVSVTPNVSTAGYISSGTAGNSSVSLTASVTTKGATTYHPSTSDQTISSSTYLTGAQTIKGVTISGLSADNIVSGVTVKIGDSTDDDCVASVTGTASSGGYFTVTDTTDAAGGTIRTITPTEGTAVIQASKSVTINSNTITTITPDTGNTALGQVVVTTDVSGGGGNPVAEEKDVIFIDYDGTIRYSYTATEFAQLTELPANPTHDGLTAQGWNWTLSDAKTYVSTYGRHCIGQNYTTTDGATRVYVDLTPNTLTPIVGLCVNGTVTIDWGDGSSTENLTGTSTSTVVWSNRHTYSSAGSYCIKLTPASGTTFGLQGSSSEIQNGTYLFRYDSSTHFLNISYHNCVKRINLGNSIIINSLGFDALQALSTISIPITVSTSNATSMFRLCYDLQCVVIPNGITSLSSYAIYYCYGVNYLSLPKSISTIGQYSISYCYVLKFLALPPDVTSYSSYGLSHDYVLSNLVGKLPYRNGTSGSTLPGNFYEYCYCLYDLSKMIPSGVTNTGANTFQYCYGLAQFSLPSTVTTIGNLAFAYCYSLSSITIPNTVTTIGSSAFYSCNKATTLSIGTGVATLPASCFQNCTSLTSVVIPSNITSFNATGGQFRYCSSLASVTFNNTMTSLPTYCFESCTSLTSFQFPTGCTTIGTYCFNNCNSLTTITIPSTVTSIGNSAFNTVSAMEEIHFTSSTPPTIGGSSTFTNLPTTCKIYVPTGTLSAYTSESNMPSSSTYTYIEE